MLIDALILTAVAVTAYLLGGVNGAIITSKYFYKKDIRDYGSGNAGLTNFYRVFGWRGTMLVIAIDILKSVGPVFFAGKFYGWYSDMALFGRAMAGLCTMIGHCYPVYYGFKGGKAVMAGGTIVLFVDWRVGLVAWAVFALLACTTGYVSLGSVCAGMAYPAAMLGFYGFSQPLALLMAALGGGLLVFRHKKNIQRLIKGEESKFKFRKG